MTIRFLSHKNRSLLLQVGGYRLKWVGGQIDVTEPQAVVVRQVMQDFPRLGIREVMPVKKATRKAPDAV